MGYSRFQVPIWNKLSVMFISNVLSLIIYEFIYSYEHPHSPPYSAKKWLWAVVKHVCVCVFIYNLHTQTFISQWNINCFWWLSHLVFHGWKALGMRLPQAELSWSFLVQMSLRTIITIIHIESFSQTWKKVRAYRLDRTNISYLK